MRRCVVLLLAGLVLALSFAEAAEEIGLKSEAYTGRFKEHPGWAELAQRLPAAAEKALATIEKRLGLTCGNPGRVAVYWVDYKGGAKAGRMGRTYYTKSPDRSVGVVLTVEYFLNGDADLETILTHELVHAIQRERLEPETYSAIPRWAREGLAIYGAGEGDWHLEYAVGRHFDDLDKVLTGLGNTENPYEGYPYYALAIRYLEETYGVAAVKAFAGRLTRGEGSADAIRAVTSKDFAAFEAEVKAYAEKAVGKYAAAAAEFGQAMKRIDEGPQAAQAAFEALQRDRPGTIFAVTAGYYRARALFNAKAYAAAETAFAAFLKENKGRVGLADEAMLYQGLCAFSEGRYQDACFSLQCLADFYPYASQRVRGLHYLAMAHQIEAEDALQALLGSDPQLKGYANYRKQALDEIEATRTRLAQLAAAPAAGQANADDPEPADEP